MKFVLCINCREKPIYIKKRKLCRKCYDSFRRGIGLDINSDWERATPKAKYKINHAAEVEFIKNYFDHNDWIYQPCQFRLTNTDKYNPDFYDVRTNTFIEVAGTRQAYHHNRYKYEMMADLFPLIKLEVRTPDGKILDEGSKSIWKYQYEKAMKLNSG